MDFELTYTKVGDYYIPNLILDEDPVTEKFYGKYSDFRRSYLRKHKPKLWMVLVNTGRAAHGRTLATDDESCWRDRGTESL